ncbi:MAG: YggS family pyridoxal phosphate-dependent enzyme [Chitinophagales bacterium]
MNLEKYKQLTHEIESQKAKLVAVSKTKPVEDILCLYQVGQRIFGENKVQELVEKFEVLPKDIEWHLIGHLQTNKVKYIAPFVSLIHSVDSLKLLQEINKQALKYNRIIDCLLQIYIATEETKFGLNRDEAVHVIESEDYRQLTNIRICGLMGMASNTIDYVKVDSEFKSLRELFDELKENYFSSSNEFRHISMGMSSDYIIALRNGATLIRIGSMLFGERD